MIRMCLSLALLGALFLSEAQAETVPIPRQKPPRPEAAYVASVPIPRPNPRRAPKRQETRDSTTIWPGKGDGWPAGDVTAARQACTAQLKGIDVAYAPLEPIGQSSGCGTPRTDRALRRRGRGARSASHGQL